ncbi:MAG: phosphonate ABC transporter ATP-binding protein [Acidaminococcaceae bacterium]|nr:phosphonate ABC transporter ATP-binding protein [Acidaminococcaceae bacterium]
MAFLECIDITKEYANTIALKKISFSVNKGEMVAIIGPSGAGKSTLLRCINRMIVPTAGDVIFDGVNFNTLNSAQLREQRRKIGMIFQHYNLVNRLSVVENVLHGRLGYKTTFEGIFGRYAEGEKEEAFKILARLGLEEQAYRRCDELSGGQKQRVGIARALIQEPKLMLCDEPIASLDPSSAKIIMDYLWDINKSIGITCFVNLHQVDVALKYADRIIGIRKGEVIYDGPPCALKKETIHQIYDSKTGELIMD